MKIALTILSILLSMSVARSQITVQQAQAQAVVLYPDLGKSGSPFHKKFMALYAAEKESNPKLVDDPTWPLRIAKLTAKELGVAPADTIEPINPRGVPGEIYGTVRRVLANAIIVEGVIREPGQEQWNGEFYLRKHPKQATLAQGDTFQDIMAARIGNYVNRGSKIRAYEYTGPVR